MTIDLSKYKSSKSNLFTGRPQGQDVREKLGLDELEKSESEIVFEIPDDVNGFNPSFYLGLLFKSYKNLGIKGFEEKYKFVIKSDNPHIIAILTRDLADAKRNAINSIENPSIFGSFLK